MTRCLGDMAAQKIGVSPIPGKYTFLFSDCVELKIHDLELDDQIIIIATDGIWQYMTNQNVAAIAQAHFDQGAAEAAANAIVRRAA